MNPFLLRPGIRQGCPLLPSLVNKMLEFLANAVRPGIRQGCPLLSSLVNKVLEFLANAVRQERK